MKNSHEIKIIEELTILSLTLVLVLSTAHNLGSLEHSFNQITGDVITKVNITSAPPTYCNFTLEPGLNLVSFYCVSYENLRDNIIENITSLEGIFEYQEGSTDPWKSYNPTLPSWVVQDLDKIYRCEGYWIRANSSEQVLIAGGLYLPTHINLVIGWNLVGYPTNETKNVTEAFSSIEGNFSEVRAFNASTQGFYNFIPPSTGALQHTKTPDGYWINANATEVWVFE